MSELVMVRPTVAVEGLQRCLEVSQPVCLWGKPGIGKSQLIAQKTFSMGLDFIDIRAVLLDPVDLRGLPYVKDGRAFWAIPSFLPTSGAGTLLLDELNRAPTLVQNACLQLVHDRRLGEYVLPDGWRIAAACNFESDGGGIQKMTSALSSRFIHINMEPDLDDWCAWAAQNGIEQVVIAFLRYRPEFLHVYDRNEHAFPTPRTWEFVSRVIKQRMDKTLELAMIAGAVGKAVAVEFVAFLELWRNLPNMKDLIADPENYPVSNEPSVLYAVASALSRYAKADNFGAILSYLKRMPAEFAVFSIKDACNRDKSLTDLPVFSKWALENQRMLG